MQKILTTATFIAIALFAVSPPAMAGVLCGWECVELDCEYTGDSGTGCEATIWGFCMDAYCAAGGEVDEEAKQDALQKVKKLLEQREEPEAVEIVETLHEFYGPSFRISTEDGVVFDAATVTGVGLGQTPKERVANCPTYDADTAAAD